MEVVITGKDFENGIIDDNDTNIGFVLESVYRSIICFEL